MERGLRGVVEMGLEGVVVALKLSSLLLLLLFLLSSLNSDLIFCCCLG